MIEVEQETMKGRAKSAGSEAMVQSINQAMLVGFFVVTNWHLKSANGLLSWIYAENAHWFF